MIRAIIVGPETRSMRSGAILLLVATFCVSLVLAAAPKARVTFELVTRPGLALTSSQQWFQLLSDLGISGLQIRAGGSRDEMGITSQGSQNAPEYKVVGILAPDNTLHLPGGKFSLSDKGRLRKWLDELSDSGPEGMTGERKPFGLTLRQFEQATADLSQPVGFSTQGMPTSKAVRKLAAGLKHSLDLDESATRAISRVKSNDELEGLSAGTALAAMLRPAGLAFSPERAQGDQLRYKVSKVQPNREHWPVGWKPKKKPPEVLNDLFALLNVEIPKDITVAEVVEAIQARLKVPFLYDHNAMAAQGLDPATVEADVLTKRMTYSQTLNKVLLRAKLKYELRVDEAEKPFLWLTTVKPAP